MASRGRLLCALNKFGLGARLLAVFALEPFQPFLLLRPLTGLLYPFAKRNFLKVFRKSQIAIMSRLFDYV